MSHSDESPSTTNRSTDQGEHGSLNGDDDGVLFSCCNGEIEIQEVRCDFTSEQVGWILKDNTNGTEAYLNPELVPGLIAMYKAFYQYASAREDTTLHPHRESDAVTLTDDGVLMVDLYDTE